MQSVATDSGNGSQTFHGWKILAVAFATQMIAIGSTTFSFGLFVQPVGDAFGAGRAELNTGMVLILLGQALCNPFIGRLFDRFSFRALMTTGLVSISLGFTAISFSESLWQIALLILLVIAPGIACVGPLCGATLVAKWFDAHRGKAMAISAVSTSVGGFMVVPYLGLLIELFGWRQSLQIHAGLSALLLLPLVWLVIGDHTEKRRRAIAAENSAETLKDVQPENFETGPEWTLVRLIKNKNFWFIAWAMGLVFAAGQCVVISLIPYGTDLGLSITRASWLVSVLAVCGIGGKMLAGTLADSYDKRHLAIVAMFFNILFMLVLYMAPPFPWLLLACVVSGITSSGLYPIYTSLLVDCFGRETYGVVMGTMSFFMMPMALVAIAAIGVIYDAKHSYDLVFLVFVGVFLLTMLLIAMVSVPEK